MGQGYHSRSPEEFREYLDRLKRENRSPNRRQLIILIDILLLVVIFYLVHYLLSSGSVNVGAKSTVENFNHHRLTVRASQVYKEEGALLYLIAENRSDILSRSASSWLLRYEWRTGEDQICSSKELEFSSFAKPIPPHSSEIMEIPIPPPSTSDPRNIEKCLPTYFRNRGRFGLNSFEKRILYLVLVFTDTKGDRAEFRLPVNPYP